MARTKTPQRGSILQQFPPASAQVLGPDGCFTQVWYRYMLNSFQREGGPQDDIYLLLLGLLTQSVQQQANSREFDSLSDDLATLTSVLLSRPSAESVVASLRDEVAELRALILSHRAYDGAIEQLNVSVETLKLQATDLQQRQQIILGSIDDQADAAESQAIAQSMAAAVQYKGVTDLEQTVSTLTTTVIPEGTNLYFTASRAITALTSAANTWTQPQTFSGGISGSVTGNAATASKWQTARTFAFTGNVTGSVAGVDGSANVSVALTIGAGQVSASMLSFTLATVATTGSYTDLSNQPVGTYTATPITATGYMSITDSGGTVRRVLVG